jgi:organic hydroperoxide reductase OsmC/OhrA
MTKIHEYSLQIKWTGNKGVGTSNYIAYDRSYIISTQNKIDILGSADAPFRGDISKHNPEDLLLASLSSCHMLWYFHLCADAGVIVTNYEDNPTGILLQNNTGSGSFSEVILNPIVTVSNKSMIEKAISLHEKANEFCFIANSVNFDVKHNPLVF